MKLIKYVIVVTILVTFSSCMRQWVEDCPGHNKNLFIRQQGRR